MGYNAAGKKIMRRKTFVSKFLEMAEINVPDNELWKWDPVGSIDCATFAASTTCCGCTRSYGGGTDVGADDND